MSKIYALVCFGLLLYAIAIALGVGGLGNMTLDIFEPITGSDMSIDIFEPISDLLEVVLH